MTQHLIDELVEALIQMVANSEADKKQYRDCHKKAVAVLEKVANGLNDATTAAEITSLQMATIITWLEVNQPDVFKRGLWDVLKAKSEVSK